MDPSRFPDWSRIGRRIGKRLKDILSPPKDTGPSKEERLAQRLRDILKGFAYFDTFGELTHWSPKDVDPVQQANTPLLVRSATAVHDQKSPSTKLTLCHDYKGGYHDYESVRPSPLPNELYSCEYLQYVETFIYFSHKLACCPPPTWTNLLHRNGVKVLGTFVIEPQTSGLERMLDCVDGEYVIAKQLASMASTFGFDGWLLNIEKEFSGHVKDLTTKLIGFIESLKRCLGPESLVVWYDALNTENEVEYQNGLSLKNLPFARAADALFTNYKWTPRHLFDSKVVAHQNGLKTSNVYFGIDVWAQNTDMPGPPRVTYPAKGGGGTNTGLAMKTLAQEGFSTAVFAPAWTYEHFATSLSGPLDVTHVTSMAKSVDRSLWEGFRLPNDVGCGCHKGKPHHTEDYQKHPILCHAREYPAGSSSYLHTDFTRAFLSRSNGVSSCLGSQAILPHVAPVANSDRESLGEEPGMPALYSSFEEGLLCIRTTVPARLQMEPGSPTADILKGAPASNAEPIRVCLAKLNMAGDGNLRAIIQLTSCKVLGTTGFYSAYRGQDCAELEYRYHAVYPDKCSASEARWLLKSTNVIAIRLQAQATESRLVEFGAFCRGCCVEEPWQAVLVVRSVSIESFEEVIPDFRIRDIRTAQLKSGTDAETRLTWQCEGSEDRWPKAMPWSVTTGPFSHFTVSIDAEEVGTAHCLEFPLRKEDYEGSDKEEVLVSICGHLFGGGTITSPSMRLAREELRPAVADSPWCMVKQEE